MVIEALVLFVLLLILVLSFRSFADFAIDIIEYRLREYELENMMNEEEDGEMQNTL